MSRYRAAVKRFLLTLLGATAGLAVVGVIIALLAGKDLGHSVAWTLVIGGGVVVVLNVVGGGAGRPLADPRTGFGFGRGDIPDSTASALWLLTGMVLVGLGVAGLLL